MYRERAFTINLFNNSKQEFLKDWEKIKNDHTKLSDYNLNKLERQILEKDIVISFLTKQLANNNINHQDSPANTDKIRYNCRNFQELNSSCDNDVPLEQCNEKRSKKRENFIIIGDSMLNNINSRGLNQKRSQSLTILVQQVTS